MTSFGYQCICVWESVCLCVYVRMCSHNVCLLAWHEGGLLGSTKWRYEFFLCCDVYCYVYVSLFDIVHNKAVFIFFLGWVVVFGLTFCNPYSSLHQIKSHDIITITIYSVFLASCRDCYFRRSFWGDFTRTRNLENSQLPPTFDMKEQLSSFTKVKDDHPLL